MLCWHNVIPEMNHNELLGWRTNTNKLAVVYLRNKSDYKRTQIRIDINKDIISKYTQNISEIYSQGNSLIENTWVCKITNQSQQEWDSLSNSGYFNSLVLSNSKMIDNKLN